MIQTETDTMEMTSQLDSISSAIEDIRLGKVVIVVDDEDRENEGDFICAAQCVTPEIINFMATHGRGLICAPLNEKRVEELKLQMMVKDMDAQQVFPRKIAPQEFDPWLILTSRLKTMPDLVIFFL